MAGAQDVGLAIEVARAGGLGSLPCAMLQPVQIEREVARFRDAVEAPLNLNFFCHEPAADTAESAAKERAWQSSLEPYYEEYGVSAPDEMAVARAPFDETLCTMVEALRPSVVSFHFGLPHERLLARVKQTGAIVFSSATTVAEAQWLEARGCDFVIAQGVEAGGHRGMFLTDDLGTQLGTFALLPQIAESVSVPIIAAGGISDARAVAGALIMGASAAQVGTAYLFTKEAKIGPLHRRALDGVGQRGTALTNLFSGRPARSVVNRLMRELGPMSEIVPEFPTAGNALAPLRKGAEGHGSDDFTSLWCGQNAPLANCASAYELTLALVAEAEQLLASRGST